MTTYQPTNDLRIMRGAATRIGCSVEEYRDRRAAGEKWCAKCRAWHVPADFSENRSNPDGLANMCRACKSAYDVAYDRQRRQLARSDAERCKAWREARKTDPDFLAREQARIAALRDGVTPAQRPPAPPPAPEAAPVEQLPTVEPPTILARVTAEWDAAAARRVRGRELRRAERRRTA